MKHASIRTCAALVLLGLLVVVPRSLFAADWVNFNSAGTPPTPFQLKRAKTKGIELKSEPGAPLRGLLFRPKGNGPFPAVVLLHGCRGIQAYQKDWAVELAGWGYVALLVDSFGPRRVESMCSIDKANTGEWYRVVGAQVPDAVGARAHLATLPFVNANRIAVMGWTQDAVLGVVFEAGVGQLYDAKFQAAVAFYPDCRGNMSGRFSAPALMLIGDKDDARRPDYCQRTAVASKGGSSALAELKLYPGAHHGFDDPQVGERFYLEDAWNTYRNPPRGITFGYSSTAHKDALKRVNEFLAKHLK